MQQRNRYFLHEKYATPGLETLLDGIAPDPVGWHDLERHAGQMQRWTRAHVPLPPGTRLVLIDLAGLSHCWALPQRTDDRQTGAAA
ncbi:MAG: hypothetical protein WB440_19770 [Steroidobacteraceae bacterium]